MDSHEKKNACPTQPILHYANNSVNTIWKSRDHK